MAKLNTKDAHHATEMEFINTLGPLLEPIERRLGESIDYINEKYPPDSTEREILEQKSISVPISWFIWMAGAAAFVSERYKLQRDSAHGTTEQPN